MVRWEVKIVLLSVGLGWMVLGGCQVQEKMYRLSDSVYTGEVVVKDPKYWIDGPVSYREALDRELVIGIGEKMVKVMLSRGGAVDTNYWFSGHKVTRWDYQRLQLETVEQPLFGRMYVGIRKGKRAVFLYWHNRPVKQWDERIGDTVWVERWEIGPWTDKVWSNIPEGIVRSVFPDFDGEYEYVAAPVVGILTALGSEKMVILRQ